MLNYQKGIHQTSKKLPETAAVNFELKREEQKLYIN